jgi:hypothetical protein
MTHDFTSKMQSSQTLLSPGNKLFHGTLLGAERLIKLGNRNFGAK